MQGQHHKGVVRVSPTRTPGLTLVSEALGARELLVLLAVRDIKVRYAQTILGIAWAILQPGLLAIVFALTVGRLVEAPGGDVPYAVFAYAGLVVWTFFANTLASASASMVGNSHLISKVWFPRLILPVAACGPFLLDLVLSFSVLLVMIVVSGVGLAASASVAPVFLLMAIIGGLGVGTWLSAVNVRYRDVQHAVPFMIQLWLFASPVAYPASLVPEQLRFVYALNPMAGAVGGFRWAMLGEPLDVPALVVSACSTVALACLGVWYFARTEESFSDVI